MARFRGFMQARGVDVVTPDMVDFTDSRLSAVIYFDYSWRRVGQDQFIRKIPYEKRALVLIEPAVVNFSMYYTGLLRRRFRTVFTWDWKLLKNHSTYVKILVPPGAPMRDYVINPFKDKTYDRRKLLVAVSANRWSYWPQATFSLRRKTYRQAYAILGDRFDLLGPDWDKPCSLVERLKGHVYGAWRGALPGGFPGKVMKMSDYRFSFCFENSVGQPGYISEKIYDCFCARTIPIYYGYKDSMCALPKGTYVDFRAFKTVSDLCAYIRDVPKSEYESYVDRIEVFLQGEEVGLHSVERLYETIYDALIGMPCD